jgi:hypothetical protein
MGGGLGIRPRTVNLETLRTDFSEEIFSKDAPGRISGAEEEDLESAVIWVHGTGLFARVFL